jgi:hypothetical protein
MDGRDPNEGARGGLTLSTARVPLSGTNTKKKRWSRAARALCQLRCFLVGQASLVKKAGGWSCWTAAAGVVWEGGEESSRGRSARALAAAGRFCVGGRRPSREPLGGGGWKSGSLCFFVSFTQTVSFSHVLRIGQTPATPASAPRPTPAWCAPAAAASTSAAAAAEPYRCCCWWCRLHPNTISILRAPAASAGDDSDPNMRLAAAVAADVAAADADTDTAPRPPPPPPIAPPTPTPPIRAAAARDTCLAICAARHAASGRSRRTASGDPAAGSSAAASRRHARTCSVRRAAARRLTFCVRVMRLAPQGLFHMRLLVVVVLWIGEGMCACERERESARARLRCAALASPH